MDNYNKHYITVDDQGHIVYRLRGGLSGALWTRPF